jgi:predicted phage tail component-like protein
MIKFANKNLPSYVKVTDLTYSILPSIDHKTEKVYGRAGSYDFGIELGERKIEAEVMIIADNQNDIIVKAREFSQWLFYKDLQSLIILDEPDKEYQARLTGDTDISELYRTGKATLTFICPSPYAESLIERSIDWSPIDYTPVSVTNYGSAETYPVVDMTMKEDATSIAILKEEKFVKVGGEETAGKTKVPYDPLVLNDLLDTYTGYTTASQIDGGTIAGTLSSNGWALQQTAGDYGSITSGWHGGAGIKTLSRPLDDFQVTGKVQLSSISPDQIGRVEIYLLDANNVIFGKVALVDNDAGMDKPRAEARAGALNGGHYFVNSYGDRKGAFSNFNGMIQIARVGRQWSAYFGKIDSNGKHHTRLNEKWYDGANNYSTKQLAKIQVHIGVNGSYAPVKNLLLTDLKVYEKSVNVDYNTQIPVIFKAGDVVTIDNQKAIVLKNGQPIFTELDPSSEFFALERGANGLLLSPPIADVNIRFKERWL